MPRDRDYDVIVIGSGVAGHCAALAALERKARVLMVEASPQIGGSSRLSTGMIMAAGTRFQAERGIVDHAEDLYHDYMNVNQWEIQPSIVRRLCDDGASTIDWLAENGVEFIDVYSSGTERAPRGHVTRGGDTIIEALSGRTSNCPGFDLAVGNRVSRLLGSNGDVTGIAIGDDVVSAGAVVLACGGLGGSAEMLSRWHPEYFASAGGPLRYAGDPANRGDNVKLGLQLNAQIARGHGLRSPMCIFRTAYLPTFALVVNQLGRRFIDESTAYSVFASLLPRQPGGIAWLMFDDAIKQRLQTATDIDGFVKFDLLGSEEGMALWRSDAIDQLAATNQLVKAETLEMLAFQLGIPVENLNSCVERYNRLIASGADIDYFKKVEGVPTFSKPPYYAARISQPLLVFSGAGVRIDDDAAVLHDSGPSIGGLFAAGEATGNVIGSVYFGSGNSLASCSVFGRQAGFSAAKCAAIVQ